MLVHVAAIGDGPRSIQALNEWRSLAQNDVVGEHRLVDDPDDADVVLVVDLHAHGSDIFPVALRRSKMRRSWRGKLRVYDQRDSGYYTHPGLYVTATPRLIGARLQKAAPYASLVAPLARSAAADPDLLFSFIGTVTHPIRKDILGLSHPRAVVEASSDVNFVAHRWDGVNDANDERVRAGHNRYLELVSRSKFVLCPRGLGSSSFRLYETMAVGRVPVIISDQWIPPDRIAWDSCSIRVPERSVRNVPSILEEQEDRWADLTSGVREAMDSFLAPTVLWHYLIERLIDVRPGLEVRPWWADRRIIRHHLRSFAKHLKLTVQPV